MNWGEYKEEQQKYIAQVEKAGVKDIDEVGDGMAELDTDGCNCNLEELGDHPVTVCWEPEQHFCRLLYVNGEELELPY